MNIGLSTLVLREFDLRTALEWTDDLGLDAVTLDYEAHIENTFEGSTDEIAADVRAGMKETNVSLEVISAFGNPLHPNDEQASEADKRLCNAIKLASELDVDTVSCFSGQPGASEAAEHPNWITVLWPCEMEDAYDYQWDLTVEYWEDAADFASEHNVSIAIELHPNNVVYEPEGLIRLREETNTDIKSVVNPANLVWMEIDPTVTLRYLDQDAALGFIKAKDLAFKNDMIDRKGVLDPTPLPDDDRSWTFKTVGTGQSEDWWANFLSVARESDCSNYVEIEQEDAEVSPAVGIEHGLEFLTQFTH